MPGSESDSDIITVIGRKDTVEKAKKMILAIQEEQVNNLLWWYLSVCLFTCTVPNLIDQPTAISLSLSLSHLNLNFFSSFFISY